MASDGHVLIIATVLRHAGHRRRHLVRPFYTPSPSMPTLRALGQPSASRIAIVVNVAFHGGTLVVDLDLHEPTAAGRRFQFEGVVGYRVLDERDLPRFWHGAIDDGAVNGRMLYEVTSGGWADEQMALSPIMAAGFYSPLREWVVLSDDWCVSVLSQDRGEPSVFER